MSFSQNVIGIDQRFLSFQSACLESLQKILPSTIGLVYTEVVIACLTCLDQGTTNMFANAKDLYDEDGILVGVAFIEKILMKLETVSL